MTRRPIGLLIAAAVAALLAPSAHAMPGACLGLLPEGLQAGQATDAAFDNAYTAGTRAMNDHRWSDAIKGFDKVINGKGTHADAALYWKAYSLSKLGRVDLATDTCSQLQTQFAASRWNRDCASLRLNMQELARQINGGISIPPLPPIDRSTLHFDLGNTAPRDPDADLKILALNSLLNRDPAQAIPLLRNILSSNQSPDLKQHALFVLAQSHSIEADVLMHDLVLGKMGPELQRQSIQASGLYKGRRADDMLVEAYRATPDVQVKRSVISALFIANDDPRLVELARAEKNIDLKRSIVSQLALMRGKAAQDYMLELLK